MSTERSSLLRTVPSPTFTVEDACTIALTHFDLRTSANLLWSYQDQNFCLLTDSGRKFVLKISNALETPQVIDLQARALEHIALADPELPVPCTVPTSNGTDYCLVSDRQGREHMVRLITWIEGQVIAETEASPALVRKMGQILARLGIALRDFSHPAASHKLLWDLKNAADLLELLPHIEATDLRARLEKVFNRFVQRVQPVISSLRSQVIHSDLNRGNILISTGEPQTVSGIIDFGDLVHTPLIMDLAIAAAYHLSDSGDPLERAMPFILGYHEVTPIGKREADLLIDLMLTRLCTSITVQTWLVKLYPENSEYLLLHNRIAKDTLKYICAFPADELGQRIMAACGHA